jgi:hypothetical protein
LAQDKLPLLVYGAYLVNANPSTGLVLARPVQDDFPGVNDAAPHNTGSNEDLLRGSRQRKSGDFRA